MGRVLGIDIDKFELVALGLTPEKYYEDHIMTKYHKRLRYIEPIESRHAYEVWYELKDPSDYS